MYYRATVAMTSNYEGDGCKTLNKTTSIEAEVTY